MTTTQHMAAHDQLRLWQERVDNAATLQELKHAQANRDAWQQFVQTLNQLQEVA